MTALVVGASSAIGAAVSTALAEDGHDLLLWGRDEERLGRVASTSAAVRSRAFDVRDRDALAAAAADVGADLRVLVWAVGVFDFGPPDETDPAVTDEVFETVLTAAARAVRLLLPAMLAADRPSSIVLIGSGADRAAFPGNAAYVAAKHGLRGLADALHLDLAGRGVRVTLVSPGLVAAGSGLGAPFALEHPDLLLRPEDVAAAVRFAVGFPEPGSVLHLDLEAGLPPA